MNMQAIMAQAQKMQRDINKKKEEIEKTIFTGKSEWVSIELNGKREAISVTLSESIELSNDDKEMLEDMVVLALNDANKKIDAAFNDKLGDYASNLSGLF